MSENPPEAAISADALETALEVLRAASTLDPADPRYLELERAAAGLRKSAQKKRRLARKREARAADRELVAQAATFRREAAQEAAPPLGSLNAQRLCYVCKGPYSDVHAFYHHLCLACGDRHFAQRGARADLRGRRALLTGGRIKIGFETALMLLRDGASVTITTRFPRDAARRYAEQPDFEAWRERLSIVGIDLRFLPDVLRLIDALRAGPPLDVLINNAAQTVRRPPAYYAELAAAERLPLDLELRPLLGGGAAAELTPSVEAPGSLLPDFLERCAQSESALFPRGRLDEERLPLDLRARNSWTLKLDEVEPIELVEVQIVSAIVPFLLTSRLRANLERSPFPERFVVNVSAVEGQFNRRYKSANHPHTNMAKAALNMQTRTSAEDLAASGIYLSSVDTGWITDENPQPTRERLREEGFRPPLDVIDGAARVYHPIVTGLAGEPLYGCFLKDYQVSPW